MKSFLSILLTILFLIAGIVALLFMEKIANIVRGLIENFIGIRIPDSDFWTGLILFSLIALVAGICSIVYEGFKLIDRPRSRQKNGKNK